MVGGMFELSPAEVRESERAQQQQLQTQMRAIERAAAPLNDRETRDLMAGVRNYAREHPGATTAQLAQEGLAYLQRMRDEGTAFGSNSARDGRIMQATRNLFEEGMRSTLGPRAEQMREYRCPVTATPSDAQTILRDLERARARSGPLNQDDAAQTIVTSIGSIIAAQGESAYRRLNGSESQALNVQIRSELKRAGMEGGGNREMIQAVLINHAPPEVAQYFTREVTHRRLGDQQAAELAINTIEHMRGTMPPEQYSDAYNTLLGTMTLRGIYPGNPQRGQYFVDGRSDTDFRTDAQVRTGTNGMPILR